MSERVWIAWSPAWNPTVVGRYTERTRDPDGNPEDQVVEARCSACSETWGPMRCGSGQVRTHISTFARVHLHRDPLETPGKQAK